MRTAWAHPGLGNPQVKGPQECGTGGGITIRFQVRPDRVPAIGQAATTGQQGRYQE